ncbi:MAG: hypothetical protein ACM3MD_04825 [Betaproteobacteria bacterium]
MKIAKEDFENYTLSQTTVTAAIDLFDPKAKPEVTSTAGPETTKAERMSSTPEATVGEGVLAEAAVSVPKSSDVSSSSGPDFLQEREEPSPSEPSASEEPLPHAGPQPAQEPGIQSQPAEEKFQPEPQPEEKPATLSGYQPEINQEPKPERKQGPMPGLKPAHKSDPVSQLKTETKPVVQPQVRTPAAVTVPEATTHTPASSKKEPVRPAAPMTPFTVIGASPSAPARSSGTIILTTFLIFVLMGFGVFMYLRSSKSTVSESTSAITTVEGLRIVNASASLEPNGDLLISGSVENTTDKERNAWYIVVDIFDANGSVMNKVRFLNGKQLFTRSDYEILAKRGVDVQGLKAKALQEQGVVVPPKGTVAFEMRYLQPPIGIASFNAVLHPFDPVRLYKEIAEEAK